jgi:hypothetical protein
MLRELRHLAQAQVAETGNFEIRVSKHETKRNDEKINGKEQNQGGNAFSFRIWRFGFSIAAPHFQRQDELPISIAEFLRRLIRPILPLLQQLHEFCRCCLVSIGAPPRRCVGTLIIVPTPQTLRACLKSLDRREKMERRGQIRAGLRRIASSI